VAKQTVATPSSIFVLSPRARQSSDCPAGHTHSPSATLEDGGKIARVAIAVGDRDVQRLVQRSVLDPAIAVGMRIAVVNPRGGLFGGLFVFIAAPKKQNPLQKAKTRSGRRTGLAGAAGISWEQPNLALAEFFTRPQAEAQIGAF
jgi:hypothetical protein